MERLVEFRYRNKIKYIALLIIIIGLVYLGYKGYNNYQRNEIIKESNTQITFSDHSSKFTKYTVSDHEHELNRSLLDSVNKIKDSVIIEFLNDTSEKIMFFALNKDTLKLKTNNGLSYHYTSSLNKGNYDKEFNDLLVNALTIFLSKNNFSEIEIYTLVPTAYDNIPVPVGTLANFDVEKEYEN